jgi:hypothetical protein
LTYNVLVTLKARRGVACQTLLRAPDGRYNEATGELTR